MARWTDSQSTSSTIASVSRTSNGTISIPSNQNWRIYGIWASSVGGKFSIEPSTLSSGKFEWIQNSTTKTSIEANTPYQVSISLNGPCDIETFFTNDAATSTTLSRIQLMYEVTTGGPA